MNEKDIAAQLYARTVNPHASSEERRKCAACCLAAAADFTEATKAKPKDAAEQK